jgi:hypothetical protein
MAFRLMMSLCMFASSLCVSAGQNTAASQGNGDGVAILDFGYLDTSGEAKDMTAEHQKWIQALAEGLRTDLARKGGYRIVTTLCRPEPCTVGSTPLEELERAAKDAGAQLLVMGAVHKESTLLQWAKVLGVNVDDNRVVFDKLLTFRGDSEEAWARAESFIAGEFLAAAPAGAVNSQPPEKLAVFPFELIDASGGGGVIPEDAIDAEQLRLATDEARRLVAESGRYKLVDVAAADAEPARAHKLNECGGCDAEIAAKLGADQSLVGVVTRVSRMDYNITYALRDARSGKVIAVAQTDLRMGANYSWPRGAAWLITNKLLAP